jgi:hypothetical protein
MPLPSSVTITAPIGPGLEATSQQLTNVTDVNFQLEHGTLQVQFGSGRFSTYDLNPVTTVTFTISGSSAAIVVS